MKGREQEKKSRVTIFLTIIVVALFVNLPLSMAVEISGVAALEITPNSAQIEWETDTISNTFVDYGVDKANTQRVGDSNLVTEHKISLQNLEPETTYHYAVQSSGVRDDRGGAFYSFETLPPDLEPPALAVEIPEKLKGTRLDLSGETEEGARVRVLVNGVVKREAIAILSGNKGVFNLTNIVLNENVLNLIKVEAEDSAGNIVSVDGSVLTDTSRPELTIEDLPSVLGHKELIVKGIVSENSSIEFFINDRSKAKALGVAFEEKIILEAGENNLRIVATDSFGWEVIKEFTITSDSQPPRVKFELVDGSEFYEGRAETDITGETKPGSKVFLFIFREGESRRKADFKRAVTSADVDAEGKFVFESVRFPPLPWQSWEDIAPKEVPSGLEDIVINPVSNLDQQQRKSYKVYIIAEDSLGRTGYLEKPVNVNTCFSAQAFHVEPIPQFQAPFRLDPQLMEEGRESIQAVFNLTYRGSAFASTLKDQKPYKIIGKPKFQKACTQEMAESDDYALGCKLLGSLTPQANGDNTAFFVTAQLGRAADFIDKEDNVWDDFQKRRLKLPIKVLIDYSERQADGKLGPRKTDVQCVDLGYFVDIPIDRENLVPDALLDVAMPVLTTTVDTIEEIKPYLQTAIKVVGAACVGSFVTKMVMRLYRVIVSKVEYLSTVAEPDDKRCPLSLVQKTLYLQSTVDEWEEIRASGHPDVLEGNGKIPSKEWFNGKILDEKCPSTANAWELEAFFDQFYRWTCDRFLCREVPAAWTGKVDEGQVKSVILKQKQCTATSNGVYLEKREDCEKLLTSNSNNNQPVALNQEIIECYMDYEGYLYVPLAADANQDLESRYIWTLTPIYQVGKVGTPTKPKLLAYKPPDADTYMVAPDQTCSNYCKRVGNYAPVQDGYTLVDSARLVNRNNVRIADVVAYNEKDFSYICDQKTGCTYKQDSTIITWENIPPDVRDEWGPKIQQEVGWDPYKGKVGNAIAIFNQNVVSKLTGAQVFSNQISGASSADVTVKAGSGACYKVDNKRSSLSQLVAGKTDDQIDLLGTVKGYDQQLWNANIPSDQLRGEQIPAGFTRDCFIGPQGEQYQCVCEPPKTPEVPLPAGVREAVKEDTEKNIKESWSYRQAIIYLDSKGLAGTHYPKWRYFTGRDLPGAFGLDHGLDNFQTDLKEKTTAQINPKTDYWAAWQAACLPGINAQLEVVQSMALGLRNCLEQAKTTGFQDAGLCKTAFAQNICGLLYKGISALTNKCSPLSLSDVGKSGALGEVGTYLDAGFSSIPEVAQSSIDELKSDYANSHLEQYFSSGVQGFTQSMCMAAFGYDFPMGMDFIMDAAYSFPMASSVFFPIASRELSTYNPVKGTATFNYNLGGTVVPGCNMRGYKVYLKCIGPTDQGKPGVQCSDEGCDCLRVSADDSAYASEKQYHSLQGAQSFAGLPRRQMFELPLPSPQKVSTNFRYDHVVVELYPDTGEPVDSCFDEGYHDGAKGIYYFPITPIKGPGGIACHVSGSTGRFVCPAIGGFFGNSLNYFESPFARCYDNEKDEFVQCNQQNLFVKDRGFNSPADEIIIKPYINLGGEGACLKVTDTRKVVDKPLIHIPAGINGPWQQQINLGEVSEAMIKGSGTATIIAKPKATCGGRVNNVHIIPGFRPSSPTFTNEEFSFTYEKVGESYTLTVPGKAKIASTQGSYAIDSDRKLLKTDAISGDKTKLSIEEINGAQFEMLGFRFDKVISATLDKDRDTCIYQAQGRGYTSIAGSSTLNVKLELLQIPDGGSGCVNANTRFPRSSLGDSIYSVEILVQAEPVKIEFDESLHKDFMAGRCNAVISRATKMVDEKKSDFNEAVALYYWAACLIREDNGKDDSLFMERLKGLLDLFFKRVYTAAEQANAWPSSVLTNPGYAKIETYLCCAAERYNFDYKQCENKESCMEI